MKIDDKAKCRVCKGEMKGYMESLKMAACNIEYHFCPTCRGNNKLGVSIKEVYL